MVLDVHDLHQKKARLIFLADFVAQEITRKFPKNTVFWSKTQCKTAAAPQIDKKNTPGGAPQGFLFGHKSIFYRFWAAWREPQNLPLAQNVA